MKCKECGKKFSADLDACPECGVSVVNDAGHAQVDTSEKEDLAPKKKTTPAWKVATVIFVVLNIAGCVIGAVEDSQISKNNEALEYYNSGDTQSAITELEELTDQNLSDDLKVETLINLGLAYISEENNDQAKVAFEEALELAEVDSYQYYYLTAELAYLNNDPQKAEENYLKALRLDPLETQINSALAVLYFDLDDQFPEFFDPEQALLHAEVAYENDEQESDLTKQNLAMAKILNGDVEEATSLLLTTDLDQYPYVASWLGWVYLSQDDEENARKYFQLAVDAGVEQDPEVYEFLNEE